MDAAARHAAWRRHDLARPRQAGLGGVAPILPCVVTHPPWAREGVIDGRCAPEVHGYACVDTGTAHSVIDIGCMTALEIEPLGTRGAKGIHSTQILCCPLYAASLTFPGSNLEPLVLADFLGARLEWEVEPEVEDKRIIVLLGRAALLKYTCIIDGPSMSVTLIRRQ